MAEFIGVNEPNPNAILMDCRVTDGLDNEGFEAALERLHRAAWPVAARRPARLHTGQLQGVLED